MKRMLCILFAALLLIGCAQSPASPIANPTANPTAEPAEPVPVTETTGYDEFCEILTAKLLDGTKNSNLSPISVYLALAMAAEGARGETQTTMLKLLGCDSLETLRGVCGAMLEALSIETEDSTLALANSIWIGDRGGALTFREEYLKNLADAYRSEAHTVEFGTEETGKQIADWITEHTRGKIKISEDAMQFDPETVAVLINTIYLKDAWLNEFYEEATESGTFYGPDGALTVGYMNRIDYGKTVVQGEGFLRYTLPLLRTSMTFILPDEGVALSDLVSSPERLHDALYGGQEVNANVRVKLPKFKFQDRFDLNDALISLGMGIAFSGEADFSGMGDFDMAISDVLQESYIGVDEKGVEAAAYTMIALAAGVWMPEDLPEIDFFLTRPFLYVIESRDGTVLFIGTVTAPESAQ